MIGIYFSISKEFNKIGKLHKVWPIHNLSDPDFIIDAYIELYNNLTDDAKKILEKALLGRD